MPNMDDVRRAVDERIAKMQEWISESAPECEVEQRHLDEGAPERHYWHYGYLIALKDIREVIEKKAAA